ncbi:cytochrome p450 [Hirsutella rhossiliensis]|uniref:Cytochrome p450 domain-containing protein n=1 Tax=Hirsutella rhossiliensis TaxID=111463 RepID=A0A9P8MST9_9HYPO|nr:cytochrome p450 domain-containing protein [Hirsutella rhossiliensis]KAH0958542.1 cytochrome p450 domain-containing protein [Hirsutella rhossiliensis]
MISGALLAVLAGVVLAYYVHQKVRESLSRAAEAKKLGCRPPVADTCDDPIGISGTLLCIRAHSDNRFLDTVQQRIRSLQERIGRPLKTVALRTLFFRDIVVTFDPRNVQAILALKAKDFDLGVNRTGNFKPLLGANGIFVATGKLWEHSRAWLRPQFVRGNIHLDREEIHTRALITALERRAGPDGWTDLVDLQEFFFRYTLDSTTDFLFGQSVSTQQGPDTPAHDASFSQAIDKTQSGISLGARLGPLYWLAHTPGFKRAVKTINAYIDRFTHAAIRLRKDEQQGLDKGAEHQEGKDTFLYRLTEDSQDPVDLRNQLLSVLLAGRDTTASTLGWLFFVIASPQYQPIFQRLRNVIVREFGEQSSPSPGDISLDRIRNCQYLQWCINECLRLYPAVPINTRIAQVNTHLPTGGGPDGTAPIWINKGEEVTYSVHLLHRCEEIWGDDAAVFRPERWEKTVSRWDYLPFNAGPRTCIGQQPALIRIAHLVIRFMLRIDAIDGSRIGPERHALTLVDCPANGVNVRLRFAA